MRFLVCRQTRAALTESVLVTYEQEILPLDGMEEIAAGCSRKVRTNYVYPSGSEIVLGGMDNPSRIASTAWDGVFVNEAIELEEDGWETIGSRLNRPGRRRGFGFLIGDTNPGDPSHWLKKRCDENRTALWQTDHEANPGMFDGRNWTEAGQTYLDSLGRLRGTRRKRLLEGIWAAGEGQWFETFGEQHVTRRAAYDPSLAVHLAIDSGVHTGAVWLQIRETPDGPVVHVAADFYSFHKPAYDNAKAIIAKSIQMGMKRLERIVTDPAGKNASAVGESTVISEYNRAGLYPDFWPSYPGSVLEGLTLIESFVAVDPPGLFVHPDCNRMREAFANYKRDKRQGQWIDRPCDPAHPFEEAMDALRGGLHDRFPAGRRPMMPTIGTAGKPYPGLHDKRYG